MTPATTLQIGVAASVTLAAWALLSLWGHHAPARSPVNVPPSGARRWLGRSWGRLARVAEAVGRRQVPTSPEEFGKLELKLIRAGFRSKRAVPIYTGLKLATAALGAVLGYLLAVGPPLRGVMALETNPVPADPDAASIRARTTPAPAATGAGGAPARRNFRMYVAAGLAAGLYLPVAAVGYLGRRRQEAIASSLPDALDLLIVCVESGLGLDAALQRVASGMRRSAPALCDELELTNLQITLGRPRREALQEICVRTGVVDLRTLATTIIQAERFGTNLTSALRTQSDALRNRRRSLAEERAAKVPVKLVLPLIVFFLPGVFVVAGGSALLTIQKQLAGGFATPRPNLLEPDQFPGDAPMDPEPPDEDPAQWQFMTPDRAGMSSGGSSTPGGGLPTTPGYGLRNGVPSSISAPVALREPWLQSLRQ